MSLPEQRRVATVAGLQTDDQGAVVILVELGPVHGDDNFLALGHDIGDPIMEQLPGAELGIGEQAVNLFDGMLAVNTAGNGEAITDGMNGEGAGLEHALSGICQGENALGMHVLAKYVVDVLEDEVVVEHGGQWSGICRSKMRIIPQKPHQASLI